MLLLKVIVDCLREGVGSPAGHDTACHRETRRQPAIDLGGRLLLLVCWKVERVVVQACLVLNLGFLLHRLQVVDQNYGSTNTPTEREPSGRQLFDEFSAAHILTFDGGVIDPHQG